MWWPDTSNGDLSGGPRFAIADNTRCQRILREGLCQVCADPLIERRRHWYLHREQLENGAYAAAVIGPSARSSSRSAASAPGAAC